MRKHRLNRRMPSSGIGVTLPLTDDGGTSAKPSSATRSQIRNAYAGRSLVARALKDLEARREDFAADTVLKWAAEVAARGSVDVPSAVRAAASWNGAEEQSGAQRNALTGLSNLLEEQISKFKKSDPAGVIIALKERIATLQSQEDQREKAGSVGRSELQNLLEELTAIDPEQPGHVKEARKGPKQV